MRSVFLLVVFICCYATSKDMKKFNDQLLKATNIYRGRHLSFPVKINPKLSEVAQKWVDHLAEKDIFEHNPNLGFNGEILGENLAMSNEEGDYPGWKPVDKWYQEIKRYNFKTHSGLNTGHFTQLVWKGSSEIGIGYAKAKSGNQYVSCTFRPSGNLVGEFEANVKPSATGTTDLVKHELLEKMESMEGKVVNVEKEEKIEDGFRKVTTIETIQYPDGSKKTLRKTMFYSL